ITLLMVLVYAWLLRTIGADRLKRALSYVQLVTGFIFYGGDLMMTQAFDRRAMASLELPDRALLYLYPSTWFVRDLARARGEVAGCGWSSGRDPRRPPFPAVRPAPGGPDRRHRRAGAERLAPQPARV